MPADRIETAIAATLINQNSPFEQTADQAVPRKNTAHLNKTNILRLTAKYKSKPGKSIFFFLFFNSRRGRKVAGKNAMTDFRTCFPGEPAVYLNSHWPRGIDPVRKTPGTVRKRQNGKVSHRMEARIKIIPDRENRQLELSEPTI